MTVTSRIPATLAYLFATFTAAPTLGAAPSPVAVWYGPAGSWAPQSLYIGLNDPDPGVIPTSAVGNQEWVGQPGRHRNEMFSVFCCAEFWSEDTDFPTAVNGVTGIVAAVETILQADINLGGNILFLDPGVTGQALRMNLTDKGAVAQVQFQIDCKARIGG